MRSCPAVYLKTKEMLVNYCKFSPQYNISLGLWILYPFLLSHLPCSSSLFPSPFLSYQEGRSVEVSFISLVVSAVPWLCRCSKKNGISAMPISVPTWSGSTACWRRGMGCATAPQGMPTPSCHSTTSRRTRSTCTGPVRWDSGPPDSTPLPRRSQKWLWLIWFNSFIFLNHKSIEQTQFKKSHSTELGVYNST